MEAVVIVAALYLSSKGRLSPNELILAPFAFITPRRSRGELVGGG
jgi:hypothetical protein